MIRIKKTILAIVVISIVLFSQNGVAQEKMEYPKTKRVDQVDDFFGTPVADPFRWLEDDVRNSERFRAWVDAQNKLTFSQIEKLPYRAEIEKRLTKLWDYEKIRCAVQTGRSLLLLQERRAAKSKRAVQT